MLTTKSNTNKGWAEMEFGIVKTKLEALYIDYFNGLYSEHQLN